MPNWWDRSATPPLLDDAGSVSTSNLAALNVTSEKLSANALRRSIAIAMPDMGAGSTAPLTSAHGIFQPSLPITVAGFSLLMQTSWVMTTAQSDGVGTLYNGANAVIGTVNIPSTSPPARGARVAGTLTTSLAVAAGQLITFGMTGASSSGWDQPDMVLQLDFDTTG